MSKISIAATIIMLSLSSTIQPQDAKPEVFVQLGHSSMVNSVAFSPDGRYALSGSDDQTLKLWEVSSGREIRTFEGHTASVLSVTFSPDGRYALSGSRDETLKQWEVSTGREIRTLKGNSMEVNSVAFSSDGKYALSGHRYHYLKLWDISSKPWEISGGREIRAFKGHSGSATSVAFSPDGRFALSGSSDKTLKLWKVSSGREIRTFEGHSNWVRSVAFSSDGKYALSGSDDLTLKLWKVSSGRQIRTFKGHSGQVASVAFSPDGRYALSGSGDLTLKLWKVSSGREIRTFKGHSNTVRSVAFSPDGKYALSGGSDETLKLWEVSSGLEIRTFQGHSREVTSVAISPNGQYALVGSIDSTLKLWQVFTGQEVRTLRGHSAPVYAAAFSPDGRYAVSGGGDMYGSDNTLKLWEIPNGLEILTFQGHSREVTSVAISPNGRYALSGSDDETLKLWDISSGQEVRTFKGHSEGVTSVAFSPDGRTALSGSDDQTLKLWEVSSGLEILTFEGYLYDINSVVFSPDGRYGLSLSGRMNRGRNTLKLWDVSSGEAIRTFEGHYKFRCAAFSPDRSAVFSPDGSNALSVSYDGALRRWDVSIGQESQTFKGHTKRIYFGAFSADGRYALSGSKDGTIGIWNIQSGNEVAQLISFNNGEWVSITPEGYYDASPNGAKHINVRIGNNVYSIDNYAETFFRPDLVQLALSGESLAGFATLDDIKLAPSVAFVNTPAKTDNDELELTLQITDAGGGIGKVRLYLNGVAVLTDGGRGMKRQQSGERRSYLLKLTDGENRLRAIVFNADNTMESNPAWHTIVADLGKETHDLYALIIGINEYANPALTLMYAVPDALLFETSLQTATAGLFDKVEITRLSTVDETSRDRIVSALESMQKLGPADTFVFYVASHGLVDDGTYYMFTSNVGSISTHKLKETALAKNDLQDLLINVPAGKKMILFDTCNSGAMGTSLEVATLTRGLSGSQAMKLLSRAVGSTVISASSSTQEALEGYKGHGLFTYVLSQGITGKADMDQDGFVKTLELANYVEEEVPEIANKEFKRKQFPMTTRTGNTFPIGKIER